MKPDKARAGCARCAGYIACISTRKKYIIYKSRDTKPALPTHPALEDEKKPKKGPTHSRKIQGGTDKMTPKTHETQETPLFTTGKYLNHFKFKRKGKKN